MESMLKFVKKEFAEAMTVDVAGLDDDEQFERVVHLALSSMPQSLGRRVGQVLAMVVAYGEFSGWDQGEQDAETFTQEFLSGFKVGVGEAAQKEFPSREQVIAAFESIATGNIWVGLEMLK